MNIFVAGLSFKTAPVELRERLAVHPTQWRCCGCRLKLVGGLSELVLLSTCNRVEIYGVAPRVNGNIRRLFEHLSGGAIDVSPYLYVKEGPDAVRHLFNVASGLDSMVVGETEISGQVKQAYLAAQAAKLTGGVLNRVFQKALQTAKKVRTQTNIGKGAISVGSVAVEMAERIFSNLADKTVMIIGAGKMGEACIRHLNKRGAHSVIVSNRSFERAQSLAAEVDGRAIRFDECLESMRSAHIVVTSTGCPHTILHREDIANVMATRNGRPLVLIDIAVPRDIAADVQQLDNVYLYDVDDLQMIVRENAKLREQEFSRCEEIIADQTAAVIAKINAVLGRTYDAAVQSKPGWVLSGVAPCYG